MVNLTGSYCAQMLTERILAEWSLGQFDKPEMPPPGRAANLLGKGKACILFPGCAVVVLVISANRLPYPLRMASGCSRHASLIIPSVAFVFPLVPPTGGEHSEGEHTDCCDVAPSVA